MRLGAVRKGDRSPRGRCCACRGGAKEEASACALPGVDGKDSVRREEGARGDECKLQVADHRKTGRKHAKAGTSEELAVVADEIVAVGEARGESRDSATLVVNLVVAQLAAWVQDFGLDRARVDVLLVEKVLDLVDWPAASSRGWGWGRVAGEGGGRASETWRGRKATEKEGGSAHNATCW